MKKMIPLAMLALVFCAASCKKETAGDKVGGAIDAGVKKVDDATKPK